MDLLRPSTWFNSDPQPIQTNPGSADTLARHAGRLAHLYAAQKAEPNRKDLRAEIKQRQQAIANHGHDIPAGEEEASTLLKKVKGN